MYLDIDSNVIAVVEGYVKAKKYEAAKEFCNDLISKYTLNSSPLQVAAVYNLMASIYIALKDYPEALRLREKALELRQQHKATISICESYNDIATVYYYMKEYVKALEWYSKAEKCINDNHHPNMTPKLKKIVYLNLVATLFRIGRYNDALRYLLKLEENLSSQDNDLRLIIMYNKAAIHMVTGDLTTAFEMLSQFYKAAKPRFQRQIIAYVEKLMGDIQFHMGKYKDAQELYNKAKPFLKNQPADYYDLLSKLSKIS